MFVTLQNIVLLNLLVAIMSNTYNFFQENSKQAYLFASARSVLNCLKAVGHNTLPPPLNLLQLLLWLVGSPLALLVPRCVKKHLPVVRAGDVVLVLVVWPMLLMGGAVALAYFSVNRAFTFAVRVRRVDGC